MPTIRPMLASNDPWRPDITQKHLDADGYMYMQPKIDGFRYLFYEGQARSRSWKLWRHQSVQAFAAGHADLIHGWDCEGTPGHAYDPNGFRDAMSGLRSEDGTKQFTLWLFDNFDPSWANYTYEHRRCSTIADLIVSGDPESGRFEVDPNSHLDTWDTPEVFFLNGQYDVKVKLCPTFVVTSISQVEAYYADFLARGWEGAILRRKGRGYKWNRSTLLEGSLTKIKPEEEFEAVILYSYAREQNNNEPTKSALGYTVRTAHQANKQATECLGGWRCHLLGNRDVEFGVGVLRGLDMAQKEELWARREEMPGQVIKCVSHGYGGGYDAPRTPVFIGFRPTEDVPDGQ